MSLLQSLSRDFDPVKFVFGHITRYLLLRQGCFSCLAFRFEIILSGACLLTSLSGLLKKKNRETCNYIINVYDDLEIDFQKKT